MPGLKPWYLLYWFMIQAIMRWSVPMSGAGMSVSGPRMSWISSMNRRVSRSSSMTLSLWASTAIPPFAPPKGMFTTAVFQVIKDARLRTSSRSTSW